MKDSLNPTVLYDFQVLHILFYTVLCAQPLSHVQVCNSMDCSTPDSSVHGISQARILEWVAISSSWGSFQPKDRTCIS